MAVARSEKSWAPLDQVTWYKSQTKEHPDWLLKESTLAEALGPTHNLTDWNKIITLCASMFELIYNLEVRSLAFFANSMGSTVSISVKRVDLAAARWTLRMRRHPWIA